MRQRQFRQRVGKSHRQQLRPGIGVRPDLMLGFGFIEGYRAIAWVSWIPNLALVEIWLRSSGRAKAASIAVAAA